MIPTVKSTSSTDVQIKAASNNWAFIDVQNLISGVKENGWKIDWFKLREYLKTNHSVTKAFMFLGHLSRYEYLYRIMHKADFSLEFRPVKLLKNGTIDGGNVDADLASFVMDFKYDYSKAIILADDGDYYRTIRSLNMQNKLGCILSPHSLNKTSQLIKSVVQRNQLISVHNLQKLIEK